MQCNVNEHLRLDEANNIDLNENLVWWHMVTIIVQCTILIYGWQYISYLNNFAI
jgi:hypothetical protein